MSSFDQSSVAGSGDLNFAVVNNTVIPDFFKSLEKVKCFLDGNIGNNGSSHSSQDDYGYERMGKEVEKLRKDLSYIGHSLRNLQNFESRACDFFNILIERSSFLEDWPTGGPNVSLIENLQDKLGSINVIMKELKFRIPLPHKLSSKEFDADQITRFGTEFGHLKEVYKLPILHVHQKFGNSSAFRDFRLVYDKLPDSRTKLCLLCFALIPENEIVKKRFMTYWWVGEGFISSQGEKADDGTDIFLSVEEVADRIFEKLANKDCIEPVNEKHRFVVDSYKMNPFVRSAVILLAKEARFFDFDDKKWYPTPNFKTSYRACLVNGYSQELVKSGSQSVTEKNGSQLDPKKLQTIFNINEPYLDFFKLEWFSKLKTVKVLYLGRWQTSAKHTIEVESVEFLKGLKSMKLLRFFSLQGIYRISKLPDSLCKLLNLRILDLRACHSLEELPDGIGSLVNLTHLDISECFLLYYIPKSMKSLSKLRVLKGFVIGDRLSEDSCTLADMLELEELRKLSIYTNTKAFHNSGGEINLPKFKNLEKLTIEWGGIDIDSQQDKGEEQPRTPATTSSKKRGVDKKQDKSRQPPNAEGFQKLKKLDLKCYPWTDAPSWLLPEKLPNIEKLYIKRGKLQNLSQGQGNDKWEVNILRLEFLSNLKMDWKKLLSSFPHLIYLEKYKCPKLTFFPCNENGIKLKPRTDAGRRAAERYNIVH
jgi:hypothetical protein